MSQYATQAEFEAYVEGWVTENADALNRLLEAASRDIDVLLGPRRTLADGAFAGMKLDPGALRDWEAAALSRATCAQAEYRADIGPVEWAAAGGGGRVKGPDFEVERPTGAIAGDRPRVGPKVATELEPIAHLRVLTANVR